MNREDLTELHYIAPIENVPSIMEYGIVSYARAAELPHRSVAMQEVQNLRSKKVVPGEEIGGYKLVSIANSQVVVEWGEKKFTIDVSESARRVPRIIDRTASAKAERPASAPPVTTAGASAPRVTSVAPTASTASNKPASGYNPPGADPDAPVGTVVAGRRKVVVPTPFGPQIEWQPVEQAGAPTPNQNSKKEQ